jgi:2-hydroxychromene-2-carboxylate isomerase
VLALFWSLAIRDGFSESFLEFHKSLFNAKHDDLADIGDEAVLRDVATKVGLDADAVAAAVASGVPAKTLAAEHTALVEDLGVFGVPTFIDGEEAVFVRFMERHRLDDLDRVIDMISWTNVNEFKRARIPR